MFSWYFSQFCKSDMSKYGYRSDSEGPFDFEITIVDCIYMLSVLTESPIVDF